MGARAEPSRPKPYDPDRWARKWGLVAGFFLLLGAVLPLGDTHVPGRAIGLRWPWETEKYVPGELTFVLAAPFVAGCIALIAAAAASIATRRIALLAAGLGAGAAVFYPDSRDWKWILVVTTGVVIGAGTHVRKWWPRSMTARWLPAVAGLGPLLSAIELFRAYASSGEHDFIGRHGWISLCWVAILMVFASLAILGIRVEDRTTVRCRLLAWLAMALLVLIPALYAAKSMAIWADLSSAWIVPSPLWVVLAMELREGCLFAGVAVLCAVGLAAWFEAHLAARAARSDTEALEQVFR